MVGEGTLRGMRNLRATQAIRSQRAIRALLFLGCRQPHRVFGYPRNCRGSRSRRIPKSLRNPMESRNARNPRNPRRHTVARARTTYRAHWDAWGMRGLRSHRAIAYKPARNSRIDLTAEGGQRRGATRRATRREFKTQNAWREIQAQATLWGPRRHYAVESIGTLRALGAVNSSYSRNTTTPRCHWAPQEPYSPKTP